MRLRLILFPILFFCGIFAALAPAHATLTSPFVTTSPIPSTRTDWTGTLAFPQFNPALGTLTEVTLSLTGNFNTVLTVTNNAGSPSSGNARTEVQFSLGSGLLPVNPIIDVYSPQFAYSLGAGESTTSGLLTKSGSSTESYTGSSILSYFTGPGSAILNASTFTQTLLANTGGGTAATQISYASLTGTVTYDYTPVPVPAAFLLLGPGLAAVVIVRKRCKS